MKIRNLNIILFLLICSQNFLYSQDLKNEMFINRNKIDNKFVSDKKTENLFNSKSEDKIQVIAEIANDSIFSIYVKNNQNTIITLIPEDNSLYIIQEAMNEKNQWEPIEFWGYSTCGNSYDNKIEFKPNDVLHLTSEKYSGNFKTKIRFRLLLDNKVYYSNVLNSKLNISKFEKSKWFMELSKNYRNKTNLEIENLMFLRNGF